MPLDRFMIAPINSGLEKDKKPWLIPSDAFERLNNAYVFRGRIRKRFGSRFMNDPSDPTVSQLSSRVRINLGNTDGSGNFSAMVPGTEFEIGQLFSVGTQIFTVYQTGTPAAMLHTGAGTGTYNTNDGDVVITGAAAGQPVFFYPATPIMGLPIYEQSDTPLANPTFAFDTQFAYEFVAGGWQRLGTGIWTGSDSQFFYWANWSGATPDTRYLFVTNNNTPDGIQYWTGAAWATLNPQINAAGDTLTTALILVVFQNRLIAFNTTEDVSSTETTYTNRARWAAFGDPTATDAWRQDIPGQGNALDAATTEDIVSVSIIKNRLIVRFEASTWEFAFTNNQAQPFVWQRLNAEFGAESTWSSVIFNDLAIDVGNVGILACNGTNVKRIDQKIPDQVWLTRDGSNSLARIYGVRDYYGEQIYWTFPNEDASQFSDTFPNKILVYNYPLDAWAFFDDSITAFGYYFNQQQSGVTWDSQEITWDNNTITWDSGASQILSQQVLAGNQEGYIFICNVDLATNAPALQITNLFINGNNQVQLTIINHNLNVSSDDGLEFINITNLNGLVPPVGGFNGSYEVTLLVDANNIVIEAPDVFAALLANAYTGGGVAARVSAIDMLTKQFNFYIDKDRDFMVPKVNFLVDRTESGAITVDYYIGSSEQSVLEFDDANSLMGNNVLETTPYALYPQENTQTRLWHPVYFQADGNAIQFRIYLSRSQLANFTLASNDFQLHAITVYAQPTTSRAQ